MAPAPVRYAHVVAVLRRSRQVVEESKRARQLAQDALKAAERHQHELLDRTTDALKIAKAQAPLNRKKSA
jgi:hypothetical protein